MSDAVSAAAPEPSPSAIGRIVGVILSPTETFASIARRPTWLAPLILWTLVSVAVTYVLIPRMDYEKMARTQLEKSGQTVSDEQVQTATERIKKFSGVFSWGFGVVGPILICLLVTVVIWGAFKAFGWDTTFQQGLAVVAHANVPNMLKAGLLAFLVSRQDTVDPQALGDLLRSNLGFLVARDSSKVLHSLLGAIDVFSLWSLFLSVVGFAAAAKIKRSSAAGVIVVLWLLATLIAAGFASLGR